MKLTIELVPETAWYNNLRKMMPVRIWDNLRRSVYAEYKYRCGVCDATGMLHCHEIWEYDDLLNIQRLKGFIALCPMCHHVKHIGFARVLADKGELDFNDVVSHFLSVNECSVEEYERYVDDAFKLWDERSNHLWTTDLGEYRDLIGGA